VAVRIPVDAYRLHRRDRRNLIRNADLQHSLVRGGYSEEHFRLYSAYLDSRHPGGGMDAPTPDQYRQFLIGSWSDTWFLELRLNDRLVAAAVTDRLEDGLSAVYTYYDPALLDRGLGHHGILRQIELARDQNLPYLYLGYWVEGSDKMAYKGRYRPLQALQGERWIALT
jgi:arginine-tRNA-protein transferase